MEGFEDIQKDFESDTLLNAEPVQGCDKWMCFNSTTNSKDDTRGGVLKGECYTTGGGVALTFWKLRGCKALKTPYFSIALTQ